MDQVHLAERSSSFGAAIERVAKAVVVLRVCNVRAFDGEGRGCSSATGFVISKEHGLILTNRHVVSCGPITADATFLSKEEVEIHAVYRDPVHDYGMLRFDPSKVRFQDIVEIPLSPERAKVGLEVRLLGNDAGEKLSILQGTLARLDREAPHYGSKDYNDHNTFYYAAASSTSGGSSGSPVIDSDGHAVALNAGGKTRSASSYYFPLHRVVRALEYIKRGEQVPRRTLQLIFKHKAFAEAVRLGLTEKMEAKIRKAFPLATGLLVVDQVVPEGPGDRAGVRPGDILLRLNGALIHEFLPLEETLDDSGTNPVILSLQRGKEAIEVSMKADDLHELTPTEFLDISGAIVHPLSYMQAINHTMKVGAVYVAASGFMFGRSNITWNTIILGIGDVDTPDLDSFEKAITEYPDLSHISIRCAQVSHRNQLFVRSCIVDRTWFVWRRGKRCDEDGLWHFRDLPPPTSPVQEEPKAVQISNRVMSGIVIVTFDVPFQADGIPMSNLYGTGVIVDAKNGLIVCDRNTVPNALGNASVTICGSLEIPADVILVHPMDNYSILKYDPSLLSVQESEERIIIEEKGEQPELFEFQRSPHALKPGSKTSFIGMSHQMTPVAQSCRVTNIERLLFSITSPPRFTAKNQLIFHVDKLVANVGGIMLDDQQRIQGFWWSFSYQSSSYKDKETFCGVAADLVFRTLEQMKAAQAETLRVYTTLALDLIVTPLSKARAGLGLSNERVKVFASDESAQNQVMTIRSVHARSKSAGLLKSGDTLLDIDGENMTTFEVLERVVDNKNQVRVTVLRDLKEIQIVVPVSELSFSGTSRLVLFAGMFLQQPHPAVAFRGFYPEELNGHVGVYCSRWFYGSPAHKYDLKATHFIIGVDEHDVTDLDDLMRVVATLADGQFVRIRTVSLKEKKRVFTLKLDYHYWPTVDLVRDPTTCKWTLNLASPEPKSNL